MKRGTRTLTSLINKKFCLKPKRSQMQLSFGMIFSIILIIVFMIFAFYAIRKFLGFQETIKIEQFFNDLQTDVDKIWKGSQASQEKEYSLPSKIDEVCFIDRENEGYNLFFQSKKIIRNEKIEHINISKIIEQENDNTFCIDNEKGKVKMILEKAFGESLVTIEKFEE